jgi:hypothetical protein
MAMDRIAEKKKFRAGNEETLANALHQFKSKCIHCHTHGHATQSYKHQITHCPNMSMDDLRQFNQLAKLRYTKPNYQHYTGVCFSCHVPQYETLHPHNPDSIKKAVTDCEFFDIILPVCFEVWANSLWKAQAEKDLGIEWRNMGEFIGWLQNRNRNAVPADLASNSEALFLWWCKNID